MFDTFNPDAASLASTGLGYSSSHSNNHALALGFNTPQPLLALGLDRDLNSADVLTLQSSDRRSGPVSSPLLNAPQPSQAASTIDALTGLGNDAPLVSVARRTTSLVRTRSGRLEASDALNPTRTERYKDDYLFRTRTSGRVQIQLTAPSFDTYLQVINPTTGRVMAEDDDSGLGVSSQLTLSAQAGVDYVIRITSFAANATGKYKLSASMETNPSAPLPTLIPATRTMPSPDFSRFRNADGYGLVDAAAAVARVTGGTRFADVPNLGGNNWGNDLVNAPKVWANGITGSNVTVAVIDTGVDYTHRDLDNNIWVNSREIAANGIDDDGNGFVDDVRGWNFVNNNNNPIDDEGHGTHIAGTIAAENNGTGVTGVAYNAKIMPVKVLNSRGQGSDQAVAAGIRYAAVNGADVINLSLGGDFPSTAIRAAIREATEQGTVVVMAAGNSARSTPGYPARYAVEAGISVGAVDRNRTVANFSNGAGFDSHLQHVVAPGVEVNSTLPGNRYISYSGTSMATPHVAGVAALMLSANPSLTPEQIRQTITGSATRINA